ncbi:hypothetical protein C0992_008753, partial [Termitomyces sp. T32_za158]
MDDMASIFYAVSLGKNIGVFITREVAALSLLRAKNNHFRCCEHFKSFAGAYIYMVSDDRNSADYIGTGLGPEPQPTTIPLSPTQLPYPSQHQGAPMMPSRKGKGTANLASPLLGSPRKAHAHAGPSSF